MTELLLTSEQIGQLVAQFFIAGAGTLSFAVLFASPKRTLPYCGLVGAMGWFIYELAVLFGLESFAASLLAVIPLTLLARIFAIVLKTHCEKGRQTEPTVPRFPAVWYRV